MSELDTAIRRFRRLRAEREAGTARALQQAFLTARTSLQAQLDSMAAWADLNPDQPLWRVLAEARTRNLLEQADRLFAQYSREVGNTVIREQQQAVAQAQTEARQLIEHGFGPPPVGVGLPFVRIPQQAITQLVATMQPGAPVRKLLDEFGGDAAKIVEGELISGVAMGRSLRQTARAISEAVGGHYDRAFLITRTETLRAYRGAQQEVYKQNEHLLEGWIWHASLTTRTCASCWAMHGTLHKVTESMSEHPAGRCSMVPRTKSWKDLGYDVPDERPDIEPGVDVFNRLNPEQQQKILSPKAYKAFRDGSIELRDLVNVRQSKTWGTTRSVGSADGALSRAAKRTAATAPPPVVKHMPVADALNLPPAPTGLARSAIDIRGDVDVRDVAEHSLRAIGRIHDDGQLPQIPIRAEFNQFSRVAGSFRFNKAGDPVEIGLDSQSKWRQTSHSTFIHEIGHFLDLSGVGTAGRFASEGDALLDRWRSSIQSSRAIKQIEQEKSVGVRQIKMPDGTTKDYPIDQKYLDYLTDKSEMWARSYWQYIAMKSGDPILLRALEEDRQSSFYPTQWTDDDFAPIAEAIDDAFRQMGWLK